MKDKLRSAAASRRSNQENDGGEAERGRKKSSGLVEISREGHQHTYDVFNERSAEVVPQDFESIEE